MSTQRAEGVKISRSIIRKRIEELKSDPLTLQLYTSFEAGAAISELMYIDELLKNSL